MIHNFTGCRRNGWNGRGGNGDKNRRGGPKITKVIIQNVGVINMNPKSRGKSSSNDRECAEEGTSSDKTTTTNVDEDVDVDDTTTTTAAVNSDVTPAEQPSRRVRRMASKTAKPKKGKENLSSIFAFSLLT